MTTYLKVLGPDNRACHGGDFDYTDYLPRDDAPGSWLPEREAVLCLSGWHWCTPESLMHEWAKPYMRVYEVEPSSDVTAVDVDGKCVSSSGRLLREYPLPEWWVGAMRCIAEEIATIPWMQRVGPVDPTWRVFPTWAAARTVARGAPWDAAWDAAREAAREAVLDVLRDAARIAAANSAWDAVRIAAWNATGSAGSGAVSGVVWDAGSDAVFDAARDAALYIATYYICADLPMYQIHRRHAAARWEVWRRGYGLVGDAQGVLYVYEADR